MRLKLEHLKEVKCHSIHCASPNPYYVIDGGLLLSDYTTQNTSPDIIFELDMTVSTPQNRFLANQGNKARFIGHVMTK